MENRVLWEENYNNSDIFEAYNKKDEFLGSLIYERVGAHYHWCWYQEQGIRMSPGCLQEVREKQKELKRELK